MKLLILVAITCLSLSVNAHERKRGEFRASVCSHGSNQYTVCFGDKQGYKAEYVSISVARVRAVEYKVLKKEPRNAGINKDLSLEVYTLQSRGEVITMEVRSNMGLPVSASGTLSSGEKFVVGNFAPVMTTL